MEGNCPGGGFPGRNYSGVIVLGGKSPGVGNSPGGVSKGVTVQGTVVLGRIVIES